MTISPHGYVLNNSVKNNEPPDSLRMTDVKNPMATEFTEQHRKITA